MSLFGIIVDKVEVKKLKDDIESKDSKIRQLEFEAKCLKREADLSKEEALNSLKKEMEGRLIKSDLERAESIASLKAYKEVDLKDLRNKMESMMQELVKALGHQKEVTVVR